jgi:Spy/CpxP family protein refolding chaperone
MKKYIVALGILSLLLAGAALVYSQDERPGPGGGFWGCPYYSGGPSDTLKLTVDQEKKLTDLQEKFLDDSDAISDEITKKERAMRKLYVAEKPDVKAIDKAEDGIKTLFDKRIALSRSFRDKARALLTEEQLKENPYAFMGPGFGGGPGLCPGGGFGPGSGRGSGRGMMGGGWGAGMMGGNGPGWDR